MKFLLDEDVPREVARCLSDVGHEVFLVAEILGAQTKDSDIWNHAVHAESVLITCNRQDFLCLAGTSPETSLVILKRRHTRQAECQHLMRLLAYAGEEGLKNNINFA